MSGGRVMAVLTDSLGRFTLRAPADVPLAISARLVGLSTQEFHLTMSATNGFIARFALHTVPLAVCSDDFGAGGVVQVIPLDVATGVSPTQGATLVASHSGHLDSEMAVPRPVDSLARLIQPERDWLHRDATIDLMVQSPGYRTWRLTSDPPPPGPCGGPGPRFLLAWLLPIN